MIQNNAAKNDIKTNKTFFIRIQQEHFYYQVCEFQLLVTIT